MTDKIKYDMPSFEGLFPVEYPDILEKFMETVDQVGGHVVLAEDGADINGLIRSIYPHHPWLISRRQAILMMWMMHQSCTALIWVLSKERSL